MRNTGSYEDDHEREVAFECNDEDVYKDQYLCRTFVATLVITPIGWLLFTVLHYLVENGGGFFDYVCVLPLVLFFVCFLRMCVCCDILDQEKPERVVVNSANTAIQETSFNHRGDVEDQVVVATPIIGVQTSEVQPYTADAVAYSVNDSYDNNQQGVETDLDPMVRRF